VTRSPESIRQPDIMKLFYTGPIESAELLSVLMAHPHIPFTTEKEDPDLPEDDLNQYVRVFVPEAEYDRAYEVFHGDKPGEI
jgi:hypothetical protein